MCVRERERGREGEIERQREREMGYTPTDRQTVREREEADPCGPLRSLPYLFRLQPSVECHTPYTKREERGKKGER